MTLTKAVGGLNHHAETGACKVNPRGAMKTASKSAAHTPSGGHAAAMQSNHCWAAHGSLLLQPRWRWLPEPARLGVFDMLGCDLLLSGVIPCTCASI